MKSRLTGRAIACLSLFLLAVLAGGQVYAQSAKTTAQPSASPAAIINEADMPIGDNANQGGTTADQNNQAAVGGFGIWDLLKMVLVLGLVIGGAYGVLYLIKKNKPGVAKDTSLIRIIGTQALPGNRHVHLIAVQKEVFLIGNADSSINLLARIENPEARDELLLLANEQENPVKKTFTDLLGSVFANGFSRNASPDSLGRPSADQTGASASDADSVDDQSGGPVTGPSGLENQRERLRKL